MHPTTLTVLDLDGSLYRSPSPPSPNPVWWFHAHSFGRPGAPGYDGRWYLRTVAAARQSINDPYSLTVVVTGRADHDEMRRAVAALLRLTELPFDHVQLKPIFFLGTTPQYKAAVVRKILSQYPTVRQVVMYDDLTENHAAVKAFVERSARKYHGVLTPGL